MGSQARLGRFRFRRQWGDRSFRRGDASEVSPRISPRKFPTSSDLIGRRTLFLCEKRKIMQMRVQSGLGKLHRGFAVAGKCICMAHRLSRRAREWGGELHRGIETNASSRRTKQNFEFLKPGVWRSRYPAPTVKISENIMVFPMRPTRLNIFSSWFLIFWASEKGENDTNRSKTSLGIPWNRMRAKWDVLELETTSLRCFGCSFSFWTPASVMVSKTVPEVLK